MGLIPVGLGPQSIFFTPAGPDILDGMPVSTSVHISGCLRHIIFLQPKSVLDIGCGFGLWGFLCREYIDVMNGNVQPEEWTMRIDGIEFWEPYIQAHQRALYTSIKIGDVRELAPDIEPYELIIAGDVIEHLDKDDGKKVIGELYEKAERALLVNIPLGEGWEHPEQYGNPGELHRSMWEESDFQDYPHIATYHELHCGRYGVFYCPKDCSNEDWANSLLISAERYEQRGETEKARKAARRAQELNPALHGAAVLYSDLSIQAGAPQEAITSLDNLLKADPAYHEGRLLLAKLLNGMALNDRGRVHLQVLLRADGVAEQTRAEAGSLLEGL